MSDGAHRAAGRLLGVDYGSARIGLALSDPMGIIASGAGVITNDGRAIPEIVQLIQREEVAAVVVGMPLRADGSQGTIETEILRFVAALSSAVAIPIERWDEGYTSVRAKEVYRQGGMKRKSRREKGRVDEMAARLLLQDYLDSTRA